MDNFIWIIVNLLHRGSSLICVYIFGLKGDNMIKVSMVVFIILLLWFCDVY